MPVRVRKLIGGIILIVGLAIYALAAMRLAVSVLPDHWAAYLPYSMVAGVIWIIPVKRLLHWMEGAS